MVDRKTFFEKIKSNGLFQTLTQSQVDGCNVILDEWDKSELTDLRWLSYMFATAYHEVDKKMQPIEEYGKGKSKPYGKMIKMSGVHYLKPIQFYYGRGLVQLTWYENYEKMGKILNVDLLNAPELALQTSVAVRIMFEGMTTGKSFAGDFTGKHLGNYFNKTTNDPIGARRIINGQDKANLIKSYYDKFLMALQ